MDHLPESVVKALEGAIVRSLSLRDATGTRTDMTGPTQPTPNRNTFSNILYRINSMSILPSRHRSYADDQAFSFVLSFITKSVIIGLEAFTAGFVVLLLVSSILFTIWRSRHPRTGADKQVVIPAWPYLKRHPIQFLPVRKNKNKMS
jgi:hypothetical protein